MKIPEVYEDHLMIEKGAAGSGLIMNIFLYYFSHFMGWFKQFISIIKWLPLLLFNLSSLLLLMIHVSTSKKRSEPFYHHHLLCNIWMMAMIPLEKGVLKERILAWSKMVKNRSMVPMNALVGCHLNSSTEKKSIISINICWFSSWNMSMVHTLITNRKFLVIICCISTDCDFPSRKIIHISSTQKT